MPFHRDSLYAPYLLICLYPIPPHAFILLLYFVRLNVPHIRFKMASVAKTLVIEYTSTLPCTKNKSDNHWRLYKHKYILL
jgi:hypothetical protein